MRVFAQPQIARSSHGEVSARREPVFAERPVGRLLVEEKQRWSIRTPRLTADIAFLEGCGVPRNMLQVAARLAATRATTARQELFAIGFDRERYWMLLADHLGVPYLAQLGGATLVARQDVVAMDLVRGAASILVCTDGETRLVLAPAADELPLLIRKLGSSPEMAARIRVASPETIRAFLASARQSALAHYAVNRLVRVLPRFSARGLSLFGRVGGPRAVASITLASVLLIPMLIKAFLLFVALAFANCAFWKLRAAFFRAEPPRLQPLPSHLLPTFTVLVPLYREAAVIPELVRHLLAMDYPASKLQIIIVLEADDCESRAAVAAHSCSSLIEVVIAAPLGPRTKPKALTYALQFARGDYITVFDAEDRPEPDQLRKAAAAFRDQPDIGCVQARLQPDNQGSWLACMFALEYAANFEVLLPALASWRVPLPLGGTSNHFPRAVLEAVGAWDPYNVTEDADLGIRLARFGYRSATILSRTYEEAPVTFGQWLPQRRRWIKGWIQTAVLCFAGKVPPGMRLRLRDRLAVHGVITAGILGLLLYPLSLAVIVATAIAFLQGETLDGPWAWLFMAMTFGNIAAIVVAAAVSTFRGLRATGATHLARLIPTLPFYWALMSLAAWQALFQFTRNASGWEKTPHGVATDRRTPLAVAILD